MKYDVIKCDDLAGLIITVNREIKCGWKCQGGVSFIYRNGLHYYCQAMIKIEE